MRNAEIDNAGEIVPDNSESCELRDARSLETIARELSALSAAKLCNRVCGCYVNKILHSRVKGGIKRLRAVQRKEMEVE